MSQATPSNPDPRPVLADPNLLAMRSDLLQLQAQGQQGANWFYWVAGLSLINSIIAATGGGVAFVIGLGITREVEFYALISAVRNPEVATAYKIGAFLFSLVASAIMAGFGWLANKRIIPVFAIGIALYLLDGLLVLKQRDYLCVAFHALALFYMVQGLMAYRKLSSTLQSNLSST